MKRIARKPVWFDPNLPIEKRVDALVARMTLREKIAQMLHTAPPIPRLGVPAYNWWNECLHGVARAGRATVFPQAIGMAAAFDRKLLARAATAISDEARAKHHDALRRDNRGIYFGLTFWTPNINIFRDPRWGRGQETYGEDPYLTAQLGVTFVRGLQGNDPRYLKVVATAKHYAVHSGPEPQRHVFDALVGQRDFRETYLPAFKACVRQGGVASIMAAYNRTNGEPCAGSPTLLQKILREEWGFDGYVVSDCWALKDFHEGHHVTKTPQESAALAIKNGCDLNCGTLYAELLEAIRQGLITEDYVTRSVTRLFTARFKLGMFDPESRVPYAKIPTRIVNCPAHRRLALQMARESVVLLKNENSVLPLRKDVASIAVVGPNATMAEVLLGNYNGFAPQLTTLFQGIIGGAAAGTQVEYTRGCHLALDKPIHEAGIQAAAKADVIVAVMGYAPGLEGEEGETMDDVAAEAGGDRLRIGLPGRQLEVLKLLHATGKPVVLVLTGGSPIELNWAAENIPGILMTWYPGEAGGEALADVLFGRYNPAGRLPLTFIRSLEDIPPITDYNMKGRTYRFMTRPPLYRFGYGLSYTSFAYSKLKLSKRAIRKDEAVKVTAEVKNTGGVAGDEVVQLYVKDIRASVPVPVRHLEGFVRVHLKPGQKTRASFSLKPEQLAAYDDAGLPFVESGEFLISVGGGQPDDPAAHAVSTTLTVA